MILEADDDQSILVHGFVQVMAAMLISLTCIEGVMLAVNRSSLDSSVRLLFVRYGEWLFVPACVLVGWIARPFSRARMLLLITTFTMGYGLITQFRGSWIWDGTFDAYDYPRWPWYRACLVGITLCLAICYLPTKSLANTTKSGILLSVLTVASLLSAALPRIWPLDSAFVATRFIGMVVALIGLIVLLFTSKVSE